MNKHSFEKPRLRFLLLENIHPNAVETLARGGYDAVQTHRGSLDEDALINALADVHFLGIRSRTQVTERVLANAPKLVAIGAFCIGTNQIDLKAAALRGVPVFNAPFSNTRSVAELVIAQTVMLMRGIPQKNAIVHRGGWVKSAEGSFEVRGKTLGIVGYGHIGTQVGILAEHMGMRVIFHDIEGKLPLGNARQVATLDELLAQSDVVTLHVPETPQTKDMIAAPQLARMKAGAHLINASRGTVVDIDALADALRGGHVAGAAIDVFPVEPSANGEEFVSPLRGLDNVILTPHIGGSTLEAQANIGLEVADKLVRYSDNGSTVTAVNFPEVSLPEHAGKCRLLHIHRNVPGVLAQINERCGRRGVNIVGQYLQTNEHIGYCVMDVDSAAQVGLEELQTIDGTIRCRLLFG
ncbi:MAG TPA: phosphoglycerate dehydrogenase [Burkholderiaceae bacterium]|nr:phosphoglycerate dehydrogenase [Burkholderiaceae bacterium]